MNEVAAFDAAAGTNGALSAARKRHDALADTVAGFKDWRPAREVLREVEAVPTCFLDYDVATVVGGHPISRVTVVHGPSEEGKTSFLLGLGRSFLARGHLFGLVDAERTTPPSWVRTMMGELAESPGFIALPVSTYEKAVDSVREFCTRIADQRAKGHLPADTVGLVGVDSIRKLVPAELFKRIAKGTGEEEKNPRGGKRGVDGYGGRAAQMKAALNAAWMDELVPLMADTRCAIVLVARETDDPEDFYGFKVGGGKAINYDASMRVRISREYLFEENGQGKKVAVGERHNVEIHKTKVAKKTAPVVYARFHVSNGSAYPEGYWPERDVLEVSQELGVVELRGSHYFFAKRRIGQGEGGALKRLQDDRALFAEVEGQCREAIRSRAAITPA